jgi:hypothetical protein
MRRGTSRTSRINRISMLSRRSMTGEMDMTESEEVTESVITMAMLTVTVGMALHVVTMAVMQIEMPTVVGAAEMDGLRMHESETKKTKIRSRERWSPKLKFLRLKQRL